MNQIENAPRAPSSIRAAVTASVWTNGVCSGVLDYTVDLVRERERGKDYAFLFERFFYFLEDRGPTVQGAVIFDELEKSQSHILIEQMEEYFLQTRRGRERSRQVIPEPFFVHSDLTSLIQVADLIAYAIAWGFRLQGRLEAPGREELSSFAEQVSALRYRATRDVLDNRDFIVWSFAVIDDLRGWKDR